MRKCQVAVVGGGPVGLLGSLLLEKFGIDYVCYEKLNEPRSHPSAHWVSAKSKLILSQINGLCNHLDLQQEDWNHFLHYRYMQRIGGYQFGATNHFQPNIDAKLAESKRYFGQFPSHISQSRLLNTFYQQLRTKDQVQFSTQIQSVLEDNSQYHLIDTHGNKICQAEYIILCNGIKSKLRDSLGITMQGESQICRIINIHFLSKRLGQCIIERKLQGMLYFIYNNVMPCVLVIHSLNNGVFVLQVPNYQPFVDLLQVYSPEQIIMSILQPAVLAVVKDDLEIVHVGQWTLQALLADRMTANNIFLAGDTAHTFTPAGGFGMNCGFQDINHLVHILHTIIRNQKANRTMLAADYDRERRRVNGLYRDKSLKNYRITEKVAAELGFPANLTLQYFKISKLIPFDLGGSAQLEKIRLIAMKILYQRAAIESPLQLFFDDFDFQTQCHSALQEQILQSNNTNNDVWAHKGVSLQQIYTHFGHLQPEHICYHNKQEGEKIIRRDGIVLRK